MLSYIVTNSGNITLVADNRSFVIGKEHPNYEKIKGGLATMSETELVNLADISLAIQNEVEAIYNGKATLSNGSVLFNGQPVHSTLANRIKELSQSGFPVTPLLRFMENLMNSPSNKVVNRLFDFLSHDGLPITEDGCFLAYKSVQNDYYSKTTGNLVLLQGKVVDGRIYNGVGETVECVRNQVDDNEQNHCSNGLHAGAFEYAGPGGYFNKKNERVVIVKINPADVVSVPTDHSSQKLRTCKYIVVGEYKEKMDRGPVYGVEADTGRVVHLDDLADMMGMGGVRQRKLKELNDYVMNEFPDGLHAGANEFLDSTKDQRREFLNAVVPKPLKVKQSNFHNVRGPDGKFKRKGG